MAKKTLLQMVQSILSSMDSDDVNSIDDTEESIQVHGIIRETYEEMMSGKEWAHLQEVCTLTSVGDTLRPTHVKLADGISEISGLRYDITAATDTDKVFAHLTYKNKNDFLDFVLQRKSSESNVVEVSENGVPLFIENDKAPEYWTSFDDEYLIFDSYEGTVESTIQGTKCIVKCTRLPTWEVSDTFTPDLPEKMFPLLLAESTRACHLYLKQQDSPTDAKRALRGWNKQRNDNERTRKEKRYTGNGRIKR